MFDGRDLLALTERRCAKYGARIALIFQGTDDGAQP
jgi:hypothetical protein